MINNIHFSQYIWNVIIKLLNLMYSKARTSLDIPRKTQSYLIIELIEYVAE